MKMEYGMKNFKLELIKKINEKKNLDSEQV